MCSMRFATPVLTQVHQTPTSSGIQSDDIGSIVLSTLVESAAYDHNIDIRTSEL